MGTRQGPEGDGLQYTSAEQHTVAARTLGSWDKQGWEAWKNNDATGFEKNTTESFISISSDGISTKAEVVKSIPTDCKVTAFSVADFKFFMLDKNAVLLTYTATQDAVCGGIKAPTNANAV